MADATLAAEVAMPANDTILVRVRRDLQRQAKIAAATEDMTLEAWLNAAITERLARRSKQGEDRQ